ncbi:MAG TPA: oligosaccharide flippase family protein [Patescibacteria group bacterium]|nr:oligosaccharide flippase family protein [Patescibacteria group bacterium]
MDSSTQSIVKHSINGVVALISKTVILEIFFGATSIIIFSVLTQAEVGLYAVVISIQRVISFVTDFGFGAALVQKKDEITVKDLHTTFTLQAALTFGIFLLTLILRAPLVSFFHLGKEGYTLLLVLVFTIFLSSFKVIPSILLERKIHFHKLIIPQTVETIAFNVILLALVLNHFGINSYTWAFLVSSIISIPVYYFVSPWEIGVGIHKESVTHLKFGLQFQAKNVLATVKDDFITVILAKFLSFTQIGFIGFAQNLAFYPYRYFVDSVTRVTFSTYARMQGDLNLLRKTIEKSLFFVSLIMFPVLIGLIVTAPYIIEFFPRWNGKWEPAYLSLVFFALNAMVSSLSGILVNVLDSNGKVKSTLRLMGIWTTLTWVLTFLFISIWGYNGVAFASFVVTLTIFYTVYLVKQIVDFSMLKSIYQPLISAVVMGVGVYLLSKVFATNLITLVVVSGVGAIIYLSIMYVMIGKEIIQDIKLVLKR